MDISQIIHKVNIILLNCNDKALQEEYITRRLLNEEIKVLESAMEQYGKDYGSDFAEWEKDGVTQVLMVEEG